MPAEFTTMAGRRLRNAIFELFTKRLNLLDPQNTNVVIAGLSNSYSGYVTTFEEYNYQRYEGASTIYGPFTLDAYIQEFERLAIRMVGRKQEFPVMGHDPDIPPPDFTAHLLSFLPPVIMDYGIV